MKTCLGIECPCKRSVCCKAPSVYQDLFFCSKCGGEYEEGECASDQVTDLEMLVEEVHELLDSHNADNCQGTCPDTAERILRDDYKAGARAHAETVKCCATPHSTELSDQFFNQLNT